MLNAGLVNGCGVQFFPAGKAANYCIFTPKRAIQKSR
jgi:hypothetical protein